jgi:hypothetical protein
MFSIVRRLQIWETLFLLSFPSSGILLHQTFEMDPRRLFVLTVVAAVAGMGSPAAAVSTGTECAVRILNVAFGHN